MNAKLLSIALRKGVSPTEFGVLLAVHQRGSMPTDDLARYAPWLEEADGEPNFRHDQIEKAIESCFSKGWLRVLTQEDCEQDRARWQEDLNQNCGEEEYTEGDVDFSQAGARLFYDILVEMDTTENKKPFQESICYAWNVPGLVATY
jgi:hypothetical protein